MDSAFLYILGIMCIYTIIPTFVVRLFGVGVYKRGTAGRGIALTFDDGPDPQYTPLLLDMLRRKQIRATFFVLGSKAERYPELIRRMHEEGHLVGVHNYVHWANALMTPKKVRAQLDYSVQVIERIIGERPIYYRPPWGIINLFDFLLLKQFRMILWSIIVGDWRSSGGKHKIKRRLLSRLKDGAVILLHDSGETFGANEDAPTYMLEALDEFIGEALSRGYDFLRIDERMSLDQRTELVKMSLRKRAIVSLWFRWDRIIYAALRIQPIDPGNPLFYYRVCTYHGEAMELTDGEQLRKGDRILELHFNNQRLFAMAAGSRSMVHLAVQMIHSVKEMLPQINEKVCDESPQQEIKAVYGITMIHRGADQLGFTLKSLPKGWFAIATKIYLRTLLRIIHPEGKSRARSKPEALTPKMLAISVRELNKRYPAGGSVVDSVPVQPAFPLRSVLAESPK
ncbi:polysaccharide deacetylase family protein [Paenibacillus filicis]|uniref:Polysaccharide deacetylase family protein n=1 Tax=Paenibacillus gyeongsangnamensis TaxID=3388067 RepID=A0ABT4Q5R9_9BACL|nr:polysaccharide deacetylase family protein [Paenibacillus filicis]MCZ8512231.1 polysaccharide deacetylase family protein [Paenibacillus filicis]